MKNRPDFFTSMIILVFVLAVGGITAGSVRQVRNNRAVPVAATPAPSHTPIPTQNTTFDDSTALRVPPPNLVTVMGDMVIVTDSSYPWINDDELVRLIANGEIPHDTVFLSLQNQNITNLTPLIELRELRTLQLAGNDGITNIFPLLWLDNLTQLTLSGMAGIHNITLLSEMVGLKILFLENIETDDLSYLQPLVNLEILAIISSGLKTVEQLTPLVNLAVLNITDNFVSDVTPLGVLENLERIIVYDNPIEAYEPFEWADRDIDRIMLVRPGAVPLMPDMPEQTENSDRYITSISNGRLSFSPRDWVTDFQLRQSLRSLRDMPFMNYPYDIREVDLSYQPITDLSPLAVLLNLEVLYIIDTEITDFSPLDGLPKLHTIIVDEYWDSPRNRLPSYE